VGLAGTFYVDYTEIRPSGLLRRNVKLHAKTHTGKAR